VGVSKTNFEQVPVSVAKKLASEEKQRVRRENKASKKSPYQKKKGGNAAAPFRRFDID
jgi:PAB1-binding protein PBP1